MTQIAWTRGKWAKLYVITLFIFMTDRSVQSEALQQFGCM